MFKSPRESELTAGYAMSDKEPPAIPDISEAMGAVADTLQGGPMEEPSELQQLAGFGSVFGRVFSRGLGKATKPQPVTASDEAALVIMRILGRVPPAPGAEQLPVPDPAKRGRTATVEGERAVVTEEVVPPPKMGESGEINVTRVAPGASAQELAVVAKLADEDPNKIMSMINNAEDLGIVLDKLGETMHQKPRTQRQIARAASFETLYTGVKAGGLLNDKQLFSLRSLVATLGDQAIEIANRIAAGDQNPKTLAEYQLVGQNLIALTRYMKGQTRETARALAQQRMIATTLDNADVQALEEALKGTDGGPDALANSAKALALKIAKGKNPGEAISEAMNNRTALEALLDFWKANNLSSFATQTANAGSTIAVSLFEMGQKGLAAGIGETRAALGFDNTYRAAEFGEVLVGATTGLYHSFGVFLNTLLTGEGALGARAGKGEQAGAIHQLAERLGAGWSPNVTEMVATPAFRVMQAVDEAVMYPTYMGELSGQAAREGIKRGLKGDELRAFIDKMIIEQEPPLDWRERALEAARRVAMQQRDNLGPFSAMAEHAYRFTQAYPIFGFVAPWIRTPARIFDYAVESTVLNALNPKLYKQLANGGPEADIAASKIVSATALAALAYSAIDSGMLTGAGPENAEQRAALERLGWQPFSVRIGGKYYSYKNWGDPLIGMYAGIATAIERARFAREPVDMNRELATAIFSSAEYMLDSSYLQGVSTFLEASKDSSGAALAKIMGATSTGFVPYSSMVASIARSADDAERAKSRTTTPGFGGEKYIDDLFNSVKEDFKLRIPGWREDARPRRYWDGEVMVPEQGSAVTFLSPVKIRNVKDDKASEELAKYGVEIREPRSRITLFPGFELELIDLDKSGKALDDYIKYTGRLRRMAVEEVINSGQYAEQPAPIKAMLLDKAIAVSSEAGVNYMRAKILEEGNQYPAIQEIRRRFMDRKEIKVEPYIGFQPGAPK